MRHPSIRTDKVIVKQLKFNNLLRAKELIISQCDCKY